MAIYHFTVKHISRGKGHSAVKASAYRSCSKLHSERDGLTHDYSRKQGLEVEGIRIPEKAPEHLQNRGKLWNEVETEIEKRKNSRLATELEGAIPRELNKEQRLKLVDRFIAEEVTAKGAVADFAIHQQKASDGKDNPHMHLLVTTRAVGEDGWAKTKIREWQQFDDKQQLEQWRAAWEKHCNRALEEAGSEARVDHRSYKARGIDKTPQIHMGKHAWHSERKGIETERGDRMPEAPRREMRHRLAVQRWLSAGAQKAASARTQVVNYLNSREWGFGRERGKEAEKAPEPTFQQKEQQREQDRGFDFER